MTTTFRQLALTLLATCCVASTASAGGFGGLAGKFNSGGGQQRSLQSGNFNSASGMKFQRFQTAKPITLGMPQSTSQFKAQRFNTNLLQKNTVFGQKFTPNLGNSLGKKKTLPWTVNSPLGGIVRTPLTPFPGGKPPKGPILDPFPGGPIVGPFKPPKGPILDPFPGGPVLDPGNGGGSTPPPPPGGGNGGGGNGGGNGGGGMPPGGGGGTGTGPGNGNGGGGGNHGKHHNCWWVLPLISSINNRPYYYPNYYPSYPTYNSAPVYVTPTYTTTVVSAPATPVASDPVILAIEPAANAEGQLVIRGQNFGAQPGQIALSLGGVQLGLEVVEWTANTIRVKMPAVQVAQGTTSTFSVARADGAMSQLFDPAQQRAVAAN